MTTTDHTTTFTSYGEDMVLTLHVDRYTNGRLHLALFCEEGPFATLTTNLPDQHLNPGEVFVKDWSENEAIVAHLESIGWFTRTGREVTSGFVFPAVMTFNLTPPTS